MDITRRSFIQAGLVLAGGVLAGCSGNNATGDGSAAISASGEASGTSATTTSGNESATGSKTLVAYYSAQGHTRTVAQTLADELGADIFEIMPEEPYTSDDLNWNNSGSRVSREHDDESLRDVPLSQSAPAAWADYDTVILGHPIWWAIAAWPTDHFATGNDFTGKRIVTFCTSASSGLGQSGQLLAQAAGTGEWQDGQRFSSGASEDEVRVWAKTL